MDPRPPETATAGLPAHDQPGLPLLTALRLVRSGIGFRLVRSGITVSIQALAVAFLVFTVAGERLADRVAGAAAERLGPVTADRVTLTRLTRPDPPAEVAAGLGRGIVPAAWAAWSGLDADAFEQVGADARALAAAERWLRELDATDAAGLLGGRSTGVAATRLAEPAEAERFVEKLEALRPAARASIPAASPAALVDLLTRKRAGVSAAIDAVAQGHADAVEALGRRYPGRRLPEVVAARPAGLAGELDRLGFDGAAVVAAAPEARRMADAANLAEAIGATAPRQAVGRLLGLPPAEVDAEAALGVATTPAGAEALAGALRAGGAAAVPPAERLAALAHARARTDAWAAAAAAAPAGRGGRTALLLGLSALVCVVGIGNAMLMSVTERFGEIATMKCLGARAGSILRMYLLEALLLGVVGAAAGALLGTALAVASALLTFGPLLGLAVPAAGQVALAVLAAAALGVALSAVAAVVPSLLAARLSPMEALRVE
ncbi:FtsX-like permease family protein [Phycisphaera mikurensis]|uniref:ABC3 transporter permease C-terminal domain-containing protein n=1 Tax=Phycisphaera mikurensis (strain NBRC 102666 / KCTC 22515 / FYK2301M01) TaxID=1142394 RepID=I0IAV3_PHYMF|nr:ABC transporter permease [Phycisphaera mikurensis]MBB6442635.1 putative ABC transport system permease protein [Phycisphaera mikurensis]BAM02391.1 hypothetical protein PSMK_02320 [Phycisphaera mikurensis NBRC 102666]